MRRWPFFLACALLAVVGLSAQDPPNLSGEWDRIEPSEATASLLTIVQDSNSIRIEQTSAAGPRSGTYGVGTFGGIVGGTSGGSSGSLQWMWKDATLVVIREQSIVEGGETKQFKHEEVWSLDGGGQLVVVIADQQTGVAPTTTRFVYRSSR